MQQVDYRTERRGLRADGSGPLPQFDAQALEAIDPDRTLERFPAISLRSVPIPPEPPTTPMLPRARRFDVPDDSDMAVTVEIVPEISASDILEECAPPKRPPPPLVLPQRASVPLDLNRLLAKAHAEASRSPEFFRGQTPVMPPVAPTSSWAAPTSDRSDPTVAMSIPMAFPLLPRRRMGWLVGTIIAAAASTLAIAAVQSTTSSARSPQSVSINKPVAAAPVPESHPTTTHAQATTPDIPIVWAQSLPQVATGVISLAAVATSHRLFIDGKLVTGASKIVSCGTHLVQVGSRGTKRYVSVPCGEEIVVAK